MSNCLLGNDLIVHNCTPRRCNECGQGYGKLEDLTDRSISDIFLTPRMSCQATCVVTLRATSFVYACGLYRVSCIGSSDTDHLSHLSRKIIFAPREELIGMFGNIIATSRCCKVAARASEQ